MGVVINKNRYDLFWFDRGAHYECEITIKNGSFLEELFGIGEDIQPCIVLFPAVLEIADNIFKQEMQDTTPIRSVLNNMKVLSQYGHDVG